MPFPVDLEIQRPEEGNRFELFISAHLNITKDSTRSRPSASVLEFSYQDATQFKSTVAHRAGKHLTVRRRSDPYISAICIWIVLAVFRKTYEERTHDYATHPVKTKNWRVNNPFFEARYISLMKPFEEVFCCSDSVGSFPDDYAPRFSRS